MATLSEREPVTVFPLAPLVPSHFGAEQDAAGARHLGPRDRSKIARSFFTTMPILLVGSLAIATLNLTGALDNPNVRRPQGAKSDTSDLGKTIKEALASANRGTDAVAVPAASVDAASVPATYRVRGGDTVSAIAGKFGLSTASVLAMNGLSWKTVIFPGQVLRLTKATKPATTQAASSAGRYVIRKGDTIGGIAKKFSVTTKALLNANGLKASSIIYAGRTLIIPRPASSTTPVVTTPVVAAPVVTPSTSASTYTIKTGDTITSIAKKFGVTVQAILDANHLTSSSIIYAGRSITIPGLSTASVGDVTTPLSPTMSANAAVIVAVGKRLGVSEYGIIIALSAAAQESGLINRQSGDKDSVGLFQQRPSTGWGTKTQLLNPTYASELFYGGPGNPNKGKTRGLLDISGWQSMTVTQAAQAVQISAYPNAYAKWETSARAWYKILA
ncbi:MAG: LysM peptidoglycan-binding protein [Glaciihabitans sp.]|jgi:LysM repeat protein|nr:LysM peptidoglycan-binding protein [Glaciihabitans sp.]